MSLAHAQGAGDQQYQDPFGNSGSGKPKATKPKATKPKTQAQTTPSPNLQPLSPSPQMGSAAATSPSTGAASTAQAQGAGGAQGLPNTGVDVRVLLLVGAALLLTGLGLRLRSAPERF